MLSFHVLRTQKKGIRIHVYRRSPVKDKLSTQRYTHKDVGSFTLSEGCPPALRAQLTPSELILLDNWLAETEFSKEFGIEPEQNDKFGKISLRVPKQLTELVEKHLYSTAKEAGVWFNPARLLLDGYKKGIIAATKKIIKSQGEVKSKPLLDALDHAGLSLDDQTDIHQQRLLLETRALFNALLKLAQPTEKTCQEFKKYAEKQGKKKTISPEDLRAWAGETKNQYPELKNWYISIAIDVLMQHNVDVRALLPLDKIARYWTLLRREKLDLKTAQSTFAKLFTLTPEQRTLVNASITATYKKAPTK